MCDLRITTIFLFLSLSCVFARESCQLHTTETTLMKEKSFEVEGRHIKILCTKRLPLNRCEGTCRSMSSPSIQSYPGLKKECRCCQETKVQGQFIVLDECYDGETLIPGEQTTLYIREPTQCKCAKCD